MQKDLRVNPDELGAAATRWQMLGIGLGAGDAPPVNLARTWPSAAATNGIHTRAAAATAAFQTRIGDTAAASHDAASEYQTQDTKAEEDAFKDVLSSVSSMIGMFSGSMGSVNAVTSMLGQLTSTAVSTSASLVNNLTGTLSHAGSSPHTPAVPVSADTPPASGPTASAPVQINQQPKEFGTGGAV
jgi:hypothetical protein